MKSKRTIKRFDFYRGPNHDGNYTLVGSQRAISHANALKRFLASSATYSEITATERSLPS